MKTLILQRTEQNEWFSVGNLAEEGKAPMCLTIERGWRNNKRNVSSIPQGTYVTSIHRSPRFGECLKVFESDGVSEVNGRHSILFHVGNFVNFERDNVVLNDTDGCILPVTNIAGRQKRGVFGGSSRTRFNELMDWIKAENGAARLIVRSAPQTNESDIVQRSDDKKPEEASSLFLSCPHCKKDFLAVLSLESDAQA